MCNTEFHASLVISYGDKDPIKPIYVWKFPLRDVHISAFLRLCLWLFVLELWLNKTLNPQLGRHGVDFGFRPESGGSGPSLL